MITVSPACFLCLLSIASWGIAAEEPPREWIDLATGHRVVRLSRAAGIANALLPAEWRYTAESDKMIISTPSGLSAVNLKTRQLGM